MESIILVVFAAVAQSFFILQSSAAFNLLELDDSAVDGYRELMNNKTETLIRMYEAFYPIFDILDKRAALLIYNTTATYNDEPAQIAIALARLNEATDCTMNSILLAVGATACDAVENARNEIYQYAENLFTIATEAIELAAECSYGQNNVIAIEKYRSQAQDILSNVNAGMYGAITTCLDTTSDDVLDVIQGEQDKSGRALVYFGNSIFNAIRIYADGVAVGSESLRLITTIENFRTSGRLAFLTDFALKFSLMEALYIYSNQNGIGLGLHDLDAVAFAHTVSNLKFGDAVDAIFYVITGFVNNVTLGLSEVEIDDFSPKDVAEETAVAKFIGATQQILISIIPDNSCALATVNEKLSATIRNIVSSYFDQIQIARTVVPDASEAIAGIKNLAPKIQAAGGEYVETFFNIFSNEINLSSGTQDLLKPLQALANTELQIMADGVSNATVLLAKAASGNEKDCLSVNVGAIKNDVIYAARSLSTVLSYAKLSIFTCDNEN